MHSSSESASTSARVIILLLLLRIPLSPAQSLKFPLPITLSFVIHHTAILAFLASLFFGNLLSFKEGGLVGFSTGVGGSLASSVLLRGGDALREFLLCEFWLENDQ